MGLVERYQELVDSIYVHRTPPPPGVLDPGFRSIDPYATREAGPDGLVRFHQQMIGDASELRYDVIEAFEQGNAVATRYVATGRKAGARFAVHGMSINEAGPAGFVRGWTHNDYRDLGAHTDGPPPAEVIDAWDGPPVSARPSTLLAKYLELVDIIFRRRALAEMSKIIDPRYISLDPFMPRAPGLAGLHQAHQRTLETYPELHYSVVGAVEVGNRLATRFIARGRNRRGVERVILGMSINHFEHGLMRRGWVMSRYDGTAEDLRG